ncbi:hypothetical protein [Humisphaera borealis]|uniref:Uncharacterized protein n=1 Tax=Humisphaera borealis TaxID=2807512 RepID=A0A7M2WXH3_9BACT|nr:hypothetical protein [Humisphaera borealis]QOV90195.1 hypothetical protein IPV69_02135 [Humisphaera borealis]
MKSTRVTTFVDMLCGISLFLLAILMTNSLTRVTLRGTGSESSARPWACIEIILERRPPDISPASQPSSQLPAEAQLRVLAAGLLPVNSGVSTSILARNAKQLSLIFYVPSPDESKPANVAIALVQDYDWTRDFVPVGLVLSGDLREVPEIAVGDLKDIIHRVMSPEKQFSSCTLGMVVRSPSSATSAPATVPVR